MNAEDYRKAIETWRKTAFEWQERESRLRRLIELFRDAAASASYAKPGVIVLYDPEAVGKTLQAILDGVTMRDDSDTRVRVDANVQRISQGAKFMISWPSVC